MLSALATGISMGLGGAAVAGLACGGCAYAARWPASQLFGKTLIAPRRPGELALTFDDGPNPVWTPRLLEMLVAHDVRATFFLVGRFAQAEPALVRQIAAAGHAIGNHSWSHPDLALTLPRKVREELTRTSETLEQITGAPVRFFRPPFGSRRPFVLRAARSLGMTPVLWNAMTTDWREPSAEAIAGRLARSINRMRRQGRAANVVLHDGNHRDQRANREPSVRAAGALVERYQANHRFVTVAEWG